MQKIGRKAFLAVLALVAAMMMLPSMVSAYPLVDLAEKWVDNKATVYISAPDAGFNNIGAYTGNYILDVRTPSGSGNPFVEFSGYCVEMAYSSSSPLQYELLPISGTRLAAAAWILSQGYTAFAPQAQVAVWELTGGDASFDLTTTTGGKFFLNSGFDATQIAQVKTIYDAALAANFNAASYVIANNPVGSTGIECAQNYVIHNPVPIPPTALLLGTGLLGLVGLRKWRRQPGA